MPSVAIFGAGVAGLTVAHELRDRGFDVTVYEADATVGGKAATQYHPIAALGNHASLSHAAFCRWICCLSQRIEGF